jgi:transcriptional regulator GlxA family with amidase domain
VVTLATKPGPMTLFPVLKVEPQATIAEFDAQHPEGADYVIVPAMSRDDDPSALQWIRSQAASGAIVIGVCVGAKVVGRAGLLDGKRATTHWYSLGELQGRHPSIRYVANRRLVADRGVATTTGISASMPMSLTLIEAIAGRDKAEAIGRDIGLADWDARHDSNAFQFTRPFALTAMRNVIGLLESRAARHRAYHRHRRSVAGAGRGRLVAHLALARGDVRRLSRRAGDAWRDSHCARRSRARLAFGAPAAGDRRLSTGPGIGPDALRH